MLVHLVSRAFPGLLPFADEVAAWRMWLALRRAFPGAWAACLIPDGAQVVVDVPDVDAARRRLARLLAWHSRRAGGRGLWMQVPRPATIPLRRQLARHVREVHLIPCRAGLVHDPLSWPWSTHRGLLGAELDPWVGAARLADEIGWPSPELATRFHEYTSTDADVAATGTAPPKRAARSEIARLPLALIGRASLSATPWSNAAVRRRVAVLLANDQGWTSSLVLARVFGTSPQTVRRLARSDASWLQAGALCLGDPRLMLDSGTALALAQATTLDALTCAPEGQRPEPRSQHVEHAPPAPTSPSRH